MKSQCVVVGSLAEVIRGDAEAVQVITGVGTVGGVTGALGEAVRAEWRSHRGLGRGCEGRVAESQGPWAKL